jgi:phage tail protein X
MERPKDHVHQLADYIKKNLKKGYTLDALRFSLMNQGYTRISVDNAIDLANKQLAEEAPIMKERPQITYRIIEEDKTKDVSVKRSFIKRVLGKWKRN